MKAKDQIVVVILIVGAFIAGYSVKEAYIHNSENIQKIVQQEEFTKEILLDSALIRIQTSFLEDDSIASVYMLNQLELRPKIGYLMLENLKRHKVLDEQSYAIAKQRMETYEFIDCCL